MVDILGAIGNFASGVSGFGQNDADKDSSGYQWGQNVNSFIDPANLAGVQSNPIEDYTTSEYDFDPSMFQFNPTTMGWDQESGQFSGGMGGWALDAYGNRQIDPAMEQMLRDAAGGLTPSVAEQQMRMGMENAQKMAMGIAMSNPNISPAMAMRLAMNAQNEMQLQTNQQAGMLRAAEMQQGRADLAKYLVEQRQQNDSMVRYFMSLGYSMDEAQMKANIALEGLRGEQHSQAEDRRLTALAAESGVALQQQAAAGSTAGSIVGAIAGGGAGASAGGQAGGSMSGDNAGGGEEFSL